MKIPLAPKPPGDRHSRSKFNIQILPTFVPSLACRANDAMEWHVMKLPNSILATVPEKKITHYLLNPAHPAGVSKAAFFLRFGFPVSEWERLAQALLRHGIENELVETVENRYGTRYVVDGHLSAPDETCLNIRSAWFIDHGTEQPRFVTAHPLPKS